MAYLDSECQFITIKRVFLFLHHVVTAGVLAYGGCAPMSTSGSQNLAVLPKRRDDSLFLRTNKNKGNAKVALAFSNC